MLRLHLLSRISHCWDTKLKYFVHKCTEIGQKLREVGVDVHLHLKYRGADKLLAQPGRKQSRKYVRDARDFNDIETPSCHQVPPLPQGKAPKEIHAILTETLACFLPVRAKDLSAPL